jgi:hypothetical protein
MLGWLYPLKFLVPGFALVQHTGTCRLEILNVFTQWEAFA